MLGTYFDPEEMNYQMVRIPIDSCDFATHMYAADDVENDGAFTHFHSPMWNSIFCRFWMRRKSGLGERYRLCFSPRSPLKRI